MELGSNFEFNINGKTREKTNDVKNYLDNRYSVYTDSGRSAIRLITSKIRNGKILLPAYICKSVVDCFQKQYQVVFYQLENYFEIDQLSLEKEIDESVSAIYIMHYFGMMQKKEILDYIKDKQNLYKFTIIEDTTHSFLTQKDTIGDYQICSLRKWFALPDGGVLYSKEKLVIEEPMVERKNIEKITKAMILKYLYIHNRLECNEKYREIFTEQEALLDRQDTIYKISNVSANLLKYVEISKVIKQRKKNWNYILQMLESKRIVPLCKGNFDSFVPFSFPILVHDRDRFRKYLMKHKIYCAVHWPIEIEAQQLFKESMNLTEHILSLPLDQRYDLEHIEYMMKIVNNFK